MQTVADAGLNGHPDLEILRHAHATGRTILTRNTGDFLGLHQSGFAHAGILAVFQEGDPLKNLSYAAIVRAIDNFLSAEVPIEGQFIPLNAWSY